MFKLIKLSPLFPNKWHFYFTKLQATLKKCENTCDPNDIQFNWFTCGKPYTTKDNHHVLQIDRYASFFDPSTGYTYHVTFDATENKPCLLLIIDDYTPEPGLMTSLAEGAIKQGYQGITIRHKESNTNCDLICTNTCMIFDASVLAKSTICPYINYARSHYPVLSKDITNFPDKKTIKTAKPGKMSLKLRKLLEPYFSQF